MGLAKQDGLYTCSRCNLRLPVEEFRMLPKEKWGGDGTPRHRFARACRSCEGKANAKKGKALDKRVEEDRRRRQRESMRKTMDEKKAQEMIFAQERARRMHEKEDSEARFMRNCAEAKKNGMSYGRYKAMIRWKEEREAKDA